MFKHGPRGRRNELPPEKRSEIARLFWLGVPAARVVKDPGIHRNTAYCYYKLIRERSAAEREAELEKLEGHIEVDESYFGGHRKGKRGRGASGKLPVCGLLKRGGEVRVILPPNCSQKHLLGAILENVELDSIVYSDGWRAYNKLSLNGFQHSRINHDKSLVDGKVPIHCIENFRGYAKRRLKPTTAALNATSGCFQGEGVSIQPSR
jgi:transposase